MALSSLRGRNVICYYSGWLQREQFAPETSISDNDVNGLMNAICGMDRSRGLDLVLHAPGGDLAATEAIVSYLRDCFGNDICAIVPQLAMSAGTMMACSCKEIVMGRQSSLGPPILNIMAWRPVASSRNFSRLWRMWSGIRRPWLFGARLSESTTPHFWAIARRLSICLERYWGPGLPTICYDMIRMLRQRRKTSSPFCAIIAPRQCITGIFRMINSRTSASILY